MSVGNLKTEGQKGNNLPWQLKMLQGLQGIINAIFATAPVTPPAPQVRQAHAYNDTGSGTVPGGNYGISIANVGTVDGIVDHSTVLKPGYTVSFSPTSIDYLDILTYDATGTEFLITYID